MVKHGVILAKTVLLQFTTVFTEELTSVEGFTEFLLLRKTMNKELKNVSKLLLIIQEGVSQTLSIPPMG
jgi:hypothetical protein